MYHNFVIKIYRLRRGEQWKSEYFGETANIGNVESYIDPAFPMDETEYSENSKGSDRTALTSWLRSVAGHRLLSREEEVELAKRIEAARGTTTGRTTGSISKS